MSKKEDWRKAEYEQTDMRCNLMKSSYTNAEGEQMGGYTLTSRTLAQCQFSVYFYATCVGM